MNAAPHTHELEFRDYGEFLDINYGDQRATVRHVRTERRLKRIGRKLVRRHDRESRKAGGHQTIYQITKEHVAAYAQTRNAPR